ncbi:MAG TPA: hypothetical protein VFI37_09040 [Gaiellaceae bacterium]|nr:hypothetical protein [Gaiellaceae bacterium]
MAQNARLKLAQPGRRLEAELLDEEPASLRVHCERIRLASRAVEREHQVLAQALPHRALRDQSLEIGDERHVVACGKLRLEPLLERREAQLLEPHDLALREALVRDVLERRPAPECECVPERCGRLPRPPLAAQPPPLRARGVEAVEVDLLRSRLEQVPGTAR